MSNSSNNTVQYSTYNNHLYYVKHVEQLTLPFICENCSSREQDDCGGMGDVQGGGGGSRDWLSPTVALIIEGDDNADTTTPPNTTTSRSC